MKRFIQLFKKLGGKEILRQYRQAGVLFFALTEILRMGFSHKGLEIVRNAVEYKIQTKLAKKYRYVFDKFDSMDFAKLEHNSSNKVWVCWLQGMDNAPVLVQRCYESLKKNMPDCEIVVLTSDNYKGYVKFPNFIEEKLADGTITMTHFSDLLRLELLIKYGGTWIDATVLCTSSNIPSCQLNSELFMYQELKPGRDGHANFVSSWFITAKTNNKNLTITREMLYEYWNKNTKMVDYFLLHQFICIVAQHYPEEWKRVPQMSSSIPHILLLELFEQCNANEFNRVCGMTCFHKLSYKFDKELINKKETYYKALVERSL